MADAAVSKTVVFDVRVRLSPRAPFALFEPAEAAMLGGFVVFAPYFRRVVYRGRGRGHESRHHDEAKRIDRVQRVVHSLADGMFMGEHSHRPDSVYAADHDACVHCRALSAARSPDERSRVSDHRRDRRSGVFRNDGRPCIHHGTDGRVSYRVRRGDCPRGSRCFALEGA